jgi:hypothetical protein
MHTSENNTRAAVVWDLTCLRKDVDRQLDDVTGTVDPAGHPCRKFGSHLRRIQDMNVKKMGETKSTCTEEEKLSDSNGPAF